uniref:Uncharacterized protein n=1 Tax=Panagrolaimus davidi TaxID=227884 RepID=A0A914Q6P3_9BILA
MFATSNNKIQKIFATPEPGFQASHGYTEGLIGHFQNRETGENERRQLLEAKKRELARMRQARSQQTAAILDQHFANGRPSTVAEKMQNILANVGLDSPDHPPNSSPNGNSSMLNGTIKESQNDKTPTISPSRRPNRLVSVEELASKVKSGSQNLHKLDSDVSKMSKVYNQMNIFNPDPTQMFATSNNGIQKSFATTIQQQQQLLTESFKIKLEENEKLFQQMQQRYPPNVVDSRKDDQKEIKLQMEESEKLLQQLQQSYLASNFDQGVFLLGNSRTNDQILLKKLQAEFRHFQQIFQDTENARKTLIEMNETLEAENQRLRNDGNLMKEEMKKTFKDSEKEFKNALEEKDSKIEKLEAELNQQLQNQLKKDCEEEKMKAKKDAEIAKLLAENLRLKTLLTSSSKLPKKEQRTQTSTQSCSIIPQSQLNIFPTKYLETFKNVQNEHQQVVELVNNAKTKACEIQAGIEKNGNTSFIGFEIPKTKAELKPLRIQLKKQEYCQSKELPAENKKQLKMNKLEVLQAVKKVQRTKKSNKKPLKTSGSISMEEMMAQLLELQDSCGFNERHPELNGQYEGGKIVQKRNLNQKMPICLSKVFNVAKTVKADNKIEDCQKVFPGLEGLPSEVDGMLLYLRKLQEEVNNEQNSTTASAEPQRQESPAKRQELETFNNQINKDEDDIANAERDIDATLPNDISLLEQINEQQLIPINELITSIDSLPIPNEEMKNCKNAIKNRSKTIEDKLLETLEKRKQNDIISTINDEFAKFKDATQPITSMTFNGTQMEFANGLKHSVESLEAVNLNEKKPKKSEQNLSAELAKAQQQIEYYQKLAADQAEALKNFDLAKSLEKQLSEATQKADKALKALGKREAMDSVSRDLVLKRFKENDDDHSPVF